MIWLGEIVAGETVPVRAQFHDDTGTAADPTAPFARMETGSGTFADLTAPTKRDSKTGYYGVDVDTTGFSAGIRTVRIGGTVATSKAVAAVYGFRVVAHRAESAAKPSDLPSTATLESRLTAARAGYLDKLNVSGTLAHSDAAGTYKADVSGLSTLTAQQVWEYVTRELTTSAGGATAQEVWEYATRTLTDKVGFTLTEDYDAAKADVLTPLQALDGKVDAILVDTDTTIPGLLTTIDTVVDDILVDTGTTLPATLTTIEGKVDTVDTVADAILVDTGTTLPATLTTIEGKVDTVDTVADAILVDTGTTIPDAIAEVLAAIPDIPPPDDGVAITQATLGTDGSPLGRVMPFGVVTVYLAGVARFQFDADGDGDYSYKLPAGSTWTLKARASGYRTMTTEVAT